MSSVRLTKNTVYKQYVFDRVGQALNDHCAAYDMNSLASMVGLKPTHNFRKRVHEMVKEGLISATTVFSPRGGLMHVFFKPINETPEMPF